jgi:hypothetical protein
MYFTNINEIIENINFDNSTEVESTTINTKFYPIELNYNDQFLWDLEVILQISKEMCPVSFKELQINESQSSYLLLLREELGKYFKGML